MAKITNWDRTEARNVSDIRSFGTVRTWQNTKTGDEVSIDYTDGDEDENTLYYIKYNGETVTARNTLSGATETVRETLRLNPDGL